MAQKRTGIIARIVPAKKGHWEVYAYTKLKSKVIGFVSSKGKHYSGPFKFGTRLIVRNGNLTAGNNELNTIKAALKNIAAVKASC